jgi:hypothetical protein
MVDASDGPLSLHDFHLLLIFITQYLLVFVTRGFAVALIANSLGEISYFAAIRHALDYYFIIRDHLASRLWQVQEV